MIFYLLLLFFLQGYGSSSTRVSTGSGSSSTEVSTVSSTRGTGDGMLLSSLSSSRATSVVGEEFCSFSSSVIISSICCFLNSSLLK